MQSFCLASRSVLLAVLAATTPLLAEPAPTTPGEIAAPSATDATALVAELRAEIAALRSDNERRLSALEAQLGAVAAAAATSAPVSTASAGAAAAAAALPTAVPPAPARLPEATGGAATAASYFNPALSVIGNFLAVGGHGRGEDDLPNAELRESEFGFGAIVDPYARADVYLAIGEEGVEVEEGFITFTALPAQLLAKVGRMRTTFGKINTLHLHTLPWPDQPLTAVNLLGSDEGWIGTGASLSRLLPLGDTFSEVTLQAFRGEAEGLFATESRSDLAYNAHWRVFGDLGEASNLEVGLSWGNGPNDAGERTNLAGLDVTYRFKPLRTTRTRSATLRGELIASQRGESGQDDIEALGWFLAGEYQFARRWRAGVRLESAERGRDANLRDDGAALLLTFSPSEFSQLRAELRQRRFAEDVTANELLFQLQFLIGAHSAHPF